MSVNTVLKRSVVPVRTEVLYLKTQGFEVLEPCLQLCVWILPAILIGQHHLPKCLLWEGIVLGFAQVGSFVWPLWCGWLFRSKLLGWLSLVGCLPSGPVLCTQLLELCRKSTTPAEMPTPKAEFSNHFINSPEDHTFDPPLSSFRVNQKTVLYLICLLMCFIPSVFCFPYCPAHLHI